MTSVSIITAALNVEQVIGNLAADILGQTDCEFQWIVVDGGSVDGTLSRLPATLGERLTVIQEADFGIYDALNKGVCACRSDYYLVMGADDRLRPDAIARYRQLARENQPDIIAASVVDSGQVFVSGRGRSWWRGHHAYISYHSTGTLIKRELHDRVGLYSTKLPIAADQFFILQAVQAGAKIWYAPEFVAGEFTRQGVSSTRHAQTLLEYSLVQLQTQRSKSVQLLLLIFRILRHWRRLIR